MTAPSDDQDATMRRLARQAQAGGTCACGDPNSPGNHRYPWEGDKAGCILPDDPPADGGRPRGEADSEAPPRHCDRCGEPVGYILCESCEGTVGSAPQSTDDDLCELRKKAFATGQETWERLAPELATRDANAAKYAAGMALANALDSLRTGVPPLLAAKNAEIELQRTEIEVLREQVADREEDRDDYASRRPHRDDCPELLEQPRVARVWQKGDPAPKNLDRSLRVTTREGTVLVCSELQRMGTPHEQWTWHVEGKTHVYAPWWEWVSDRGPLTEVLGEVIEDGDSGG